MVRTCREKDRGRCSNEIMEDGIGWTPKDKKTKTEVDSDIKRPGGNNSIKRSSTSPQKVETLLQPQKLKRLKKSVLTITISYNIEIL